MVGGISFSGLASGLDTGAIIQALIQAERRPITLLEGRRFGEQSKIDQVGTFRGLVNTLRSEANDLSTLGGFLNYTASTNLPGIADVSASSTATAGTHTLTSFALATADRWAFDSVSSPTQTLGTADGQGVQFDYNGTSYDFTFDAAESTLDEIADAITTGTSGEVQAIVINSGTAAAPSYELVLNGSETGEPNRISNITSTLSRLTIDGTGPDAGGVAQSANNLTVAGNAFAEIDGVLVERTSNEFSDVLPGVSISLLDADPATEISFTVSPDKAAIKGELQSFVDAYNAVVEFMNSQNQVDEDGVASGPLFGDNLLSTVQRTLRSVLFNQSAADAQNDTAGFGTLRLVGIELQNDGTLTIDNAALDAKLDEDINAVADLFTDSDGFDNGGVPAGDPSQFIDTTADSGLADDLMRALDLLLKDSTGPNSSTYESFFDARIDALNDNVSRLNDQIEAQEYRLERSEERLVARFTALESLLGELNAQQAYLTQQLGQLG